MAKIIKIKEFNRLKASDEMVAVSDLPKKWKDIIYKYKLGAATAISWSIGNEDNSPKIIQESEDETVIINTSVVRQLLSRELNKTEDELLKLCINYLLRLNDYRLFLEISKGYRSQLSTYGTNNVLKLALGLNWFIPHHFYFNTITHLKPDSFFEYEGRKIRVYNKIRGTKDIYFYYGDEKVLVKDVMEELNEFVKQNKNLLRKENYFN